MDNLTVKNTHILSENFQDLTEIALKEKIKMQKNIFNLEYSYKKIDIDHTFPKYIIENREKLKKWII